MIYTLTLNPAIDYTVFLRDLALGQVNRAAGERITFGGKGVNVSRVLGVFGVENTALGFLAGFTGRALADGLAAEKIKGDFIFLTQGNTRINVKLESVQETEINGCGPQILQQDLNCLIQKLRKLSSADTLVLSGSAPSSLSPVMYKELLQTISASGVRFVADVSGEALKSVLAFRPYLIKPNRQELSVLCGRPLAREAEVREAAMAIVGQGIEYVLVSLGAEGAALATAAGKYFTVKAPQGTVCSTVGSGDALLAGFLSAIQFDPADLQRALKMGTAAGSAAAFTDPAAQLQIDQIQSLYQKIY